MSATGNVLVLLTLSTAMRERYRTQLQTRFPELQINCAGNSSEAAPHIASTEILLTNSLSLTDSILRQALNLKWIHALTSGTDGIVTLPSLRPEVLITNTRGIHGAAVSEAALMAMLVLSRALPRAILNQHRRIWERWPCSLIEGKTVGIFGVGAIGSVLAARCKALGMNVIGIARTIRRIEGVDRMATWADAPQIVRQLDFVVLLLPSTTQTRGIFGRTLLAAMKSTAYLINLARGDVVDEDAMLAALIERRIAGAALDVFRTEPLPADHPLWSLDNVIVTPHTAGAFDQYPERALPVIEANMRRYLASDVANMVDVVRSGLTAAPDTMIDTN